VKDIFEIRSSEIGLWVENDRVTSFTIQPEAHGYLLQHFNMCTPLQRVFLRDELELLREHIQNDHADILTKHAAVAESAWDVSDCWVKSVCPLFTQSGYRCVECMTEDELCDLRMTKEEVYAIWTSEEW
jgi:hypothetical protein